MLDISEAYHFFDRLKSDKKYVLNGVVFSNMLHVSFGRTYLRTNIRLDCNYSFGFDTEYVSYRIWDYKGQELIEECKTVFAEQQADVLELRTYIKAGFPDIAVHVILCGYDFVRFHETVYLDDLIMTGKSVLEIIEAGKENWDLESAKEFQQYKAKRYESSKTNVEKLKQERKLEDQKQRQALEASREVWEARQKEVCTPHPGIVKLEQTLGNL